MKIKKKRKEKYWRDLVQVSFSLYILGNKRIGLNKNVNKGLSIGYPPMSNMSFGLFYSWDPIPGDEVSKLSASYMGI